MNLIFMYLQFLDYKTLKLINNKKYNIFHKKMHTLKY